MTRVIREWNLLHLTDLHLDQKIRIDEDKAQTDDAFRESPIEKVVSLLDRYPKHSFDAILVTGDVTTKGNKEGLDLFRDSLVPILRTLCRTEQPNAICVVPGNHDVTRKADKKNPAYFDEKFEAFRKLITDIGATSCFLPTGTVTNNGISRINFAEEFSSPLYIDDEQNLIVLCINSSMRCGEVNERQLNEMLDLVVRCEAATAKFKEETGNVLADQEKWNDVSSAFLEIRKLAAEQALYDIPQVTETQIEKLRDKLHQAFRCRTERRSYLKIAILHHHLISFPSQITEHKPFEILPDASSIFNLLNACEFHIAFTGHKHQAYFQPHITYKDHAQKTSTSDTVLWIGGGSTVCGNSPPNGFRGFRHVRISHSGGAWTCCLADIDIRSQDQHKSDFLDEAIGQAKPIKIGPGSIHLDTRNGCRPPDPDLLSTETTHSQNNSTESFLLLNVVSCKEARSFASKALSQILRAEHLEQLSFVGLYDLYGTYDLLIRLDDHRLSREMSRDIMDKLKTALRPYINGDKTTIHFDGGLTLLGQPGIRTHYYYASQEGYSSTRSQKAFIRATDTEEWNDGDKDRLKRLATEFLQQHQEQLLGSYWTLLWGERDIIIEVLLRCGQYYLLEEFTRALETIVDAKDKNKQTHMAYCHEEFHLYPVA